MTTLKLLFVQILTIALLVVLKRLRASDSVDFHTYVKARKKIYGWIACLEERFGNPRG